MKERQFVWKVKTNPEPIVTKTYLMTAIYEIFNLNSVGCSNRLWQTLDEACNSLIALSLELSERAFQMQDPIYKFNVLVTSVILLCTNERSSTVV